MTDPARKPTESLRSRIATYGIAFVIALMLLHAFGTGSPIPMWSTQSLENPIKVVEVTADHIQLEDGRQIRLKYIAALPRENPTFLAAMRDGVEIDEKGDAFGRLWHMRSCGNDHNWAYKSRISLSALSAMLMPEGIDRQLVDDETIAEVSPITVNEKWPAWIQSLDYSHLFTTGAALDSGAADKAFFADRKSVV